MFAQGCDMQDLFIVIYIAVAEAGLSMSGRRSVVVVNLPPVLSSANHFPLELRIGGDAAF
jgi:hypothetical protein